VLTAERATNCATEDLLWVIAFAVYERLTSGQPALPALKLLLFEASDLGQKTLQGRWDELLSEMISPVVLDIYVSIQ
jgi:hypothetical protein